MALIAGPPSLPANGTFSLSDPAAFKPNNPAWLRATAEGAATARLPEPCPVLQQFKVRAVLVETQRDQLGPVSSSARSACAGGVAGGVCAHAGARRVARVAQPRGVPRQPGAAGATHARVRAPSTTLPLPSPQTLPPSPPPPPPPSWAGRPRSRGSGLARSLSPRCCAMCCCARCARFSLAVFWGGPVHCVQ